MGFKKGSKRTINFECDKECGGKCCIGGTQVLASEFKALYKKTPIAPQIMVMQLNKTLPSEFISLVKENALVVKGNGQKFYLFLDFMAGYRGGGLPCPLLKDGLCSIYEERPLKCRLLPVHPLVPEVWLDTAIETMRNTECTGFLSPDRTDATIWKNGKLTDTNTVKERRRYFSELKKHRPFLEALMSVGSDIEEEENDNSFSGYFEAQSIIKDFLSGKEMPQAEHSFFSFPYYIPNLMSTLLDVSGIEPDDFINSQIKILNSEKIRLSEDWNRLKGAQEMLEMITLSKEMIEKDKISN